MYGARRDGMAMDTSKVGGGIGCRCEVGKRCGTGEDAGGKSMMKRNDAKRAKQGDAAG